VKTLLTGAVDVRHGDYYGEHRLKFAAYERAPLARRRTVGPHQIKSYPAE
jgi:hypothetical protein